MRRKETLATGEIYHVFNKTIAGFKIFNSEEDFLRTKQMFAYYQMAETPMPFSNFLISGAVKSNGVEQSIQELVRSQNRLVQIIAYCVMPTHVHFVLKQIQDGGIMKFMGNIQNSYSRYFNTKYHRNGPLWVSRFKNVRVETDEQFLHLTRYIHLNPVTAFLVEDPQSWPASSYNEYLNGRDKKEGLCNYDGFFNMSSAEYIAFVADGIDYQKQLAKIKKLLFE